MNGGRLLLAIAGVVTGTSAFADQPRAAATAATICSLSGAVCATHGPAGATVWRKLPGGGRKALWRAASQGANLQVADDGLSLVEVQPWSNLVVSSAGPGTTIFTFFRPGALPVRVSLGEMIQNVAALPKTVSHRNWARMFGYDGRGHFEVDTVEGRRILFDPRTGRPVPR